MGQNVWRETAIQGENDLPLSCNSLSSFWYNNHITFLDHISIMQFGSLGQQVLMVVLLPTKELPEVGAEVFSGFCFVTYINSDLFEMAISQCKKSRM